MSAIASQSTLVAEPAAPVPTRRHRRLRRDAALVAAVVVLGGALVAWLVLMNAVSYRAFIPNSDDANAILASHAMAHGNFALGHWQLPSDSYWLLDLVLGTPLLVFAHPAEPALHWVPLAVATITVVVAGAAAFRWAPRRAGAVGAGVTVLILALPTPLFAEFFLQGPMHVLTTAACLGGILALAPPLRTWRCLVGVALLTAAVVGDPLAWALGFAPVAGATMLEVVRRRDLRLLVTRVATLGAVPLAWLVVHLSLQAAGGFTTFPGPAAVPSSIWPHNLPVAGRTLLAILGATRGSPMSTANPVLHWVHAVGAILVGLGIAYGLARIARSLASPVLDRRTRVPVGNPVESGGRWVEEAVVLGLLASVAIFVVATPHPASTFYNRYLNPAVIYGAVLGGRAVAALLSRARLRVVALAGVCGVGALGLYLGTPVAMAEAAPPPSPFAPVIQWLDAHHLDQGFGTYWTAGSITVMSGGKVTVVTVADVGGELHGLTRYGSSESYAPDASRPARFIVFQPSAPWGNVDVASAVATFGPYSQIQDVGVFRVVVWGKGDLATRLGPVLSMNSP